jgi:hypothetical protein
LQILFKIQANGVQPQTFTVGLKGPVVVLAPCGAAGPTARLQALVVRTTHTKSLFVCVTGSYGESGNARAESARGANASLPWSGRINAAVVAPELDLGRSTATVPATVQPPPVRRKKEKRLRKTGWPSDGSYPPTEVSEISVCLEHVFFSLSTGHATGEVGPVHGSRQGTSERSTVRDVKSHI